MSDLDISDYMLTLGKEAKTASYSMAKARTDQKNSALHHIADLITRNEDNILCNNEKDVKAGEQASMSIYLLDRLRITKKTIASMVEGLQKIAELTDPIGEINELTYRPSGIQVGRMRVPLGVVGMIYEARPNVTVDAAGLCIKSGNAIILRGGSDAIHSNQVLAKLICQGLAIAGLPQSAVQLVATTNRSAVSHLLTMRSFIDVIIPRGGKSLIQRVSQEATIPVIKHLDGNCHIYVAKSADIPKAITIIENAKTQRLSTCNTLESLLVDFAIAHEILPKIFAMLKTHQVELRGCKQTLKIVPEAQSATEEDYATEYLDAILSCKVVDGLDEAITHINRYSSQHTEAILTENIEEARRFLREIDSSSVMVNASTRFADGFEYGLGAEIGISTDKFHTRGPVGLEGLTSLKYIVLGNGHIRK